MMRPEISEYGAYLRTSWMGINFFRKLDKRRGSKQRRHIQKISEAFVNPSRSTARVIRRKSQQIVKSKGNGHLGDHCSVDCTTDRVKRIKNAGVLRRRHVR